MRQKTNQTTPGSTSPAAETLPGTNGNTATTSASKARSPRSGQKGGKRSAGRGRSTGASETGRLIEALLKSRGPKGATEQDLQQIVAWAQGIHAEATAIEAEAADLRKLGPRGGRSGGAATRQKQQRQARQQELEQRRQRHEMDRALLEGILEGRIALDVQPEGKLLFLHGSSGRDGSVAEPEREIPAG